jgi:hypothetical protein
MKLPKASLIVKNISIGVGMMLLLLMAWKTEENTKIALKNHELIKTNQELIKTNQEQIKKLIEINIGYSVRMEEANIRMEEASKKLTTLLEHTEATTCPSKK